MSVTAGKIVSEGVEYDQPIPMTSGQGQDAFAFALADLICWVRARGWRIRLCEVGVQQRREALLADGSRIKTLDCVHRATPPSLHYDRRAVDVILIVNGRWVKESGGPEFKELHAVWRALHPNCRHGNGKSSDDGHLSLVINAAERW